MGDGSVDKAKGNIKEAGGDLTGDDSLKREGKVDKGSGKVKDAVGGVTDKLKDAATRTAKVARLPPAWLLAPEQPTARRRAAEALLVERRVDAHERDLGDEAGGPERVDAALAAARTRAWR